MTISSRTRPWVRSQRPDTGFSLVELLVVLAVVSVLLAILLPVAAHIRDSALRGKSRAQLAGYAVAYEAFRADHGYYPSMGTSRPEFALKGNNRVFIETLSGYSVQGEAASDPYAVRANPRRTRYYSFSAAEFAPSDSHYAGEIVDAFGNPNIVVVTDRRGSGVVRARDFETLPADRRSETLMGGVFFYVANPENNPEWEWILTWDP